MDRMDDDSKISQRKVGRNGRIDESYVKSKLIMKYCWEPTYVMV